MSIFGGLRSGVSGLFVQSQSMAMISDNIANVNTVGYKVNRPRFSTLVTDSGSATLFSAGGVASAVTREISSQGLLQASSTSTDIAISGSGFFAVTDEVTFNTNTGNYDPTGQILYTRSGEFRPDQDGNLVNTGGFFLLGFDRNATNTGFDVTNVLSTTTSINVAASSASPVATSSIDLSANLQASTAAGSTFNIALQTFDRQGTTHTLTLTFTKNATANVWEVDGTIDNAADFVDAATGAATNGGQTIDLGEIVFNADGTISNYDPTGAISGNNAGAFASNPGTTTETMQFFMDYDGDETGDADRVTIAVDFGTTDGSDGLTQFEGESTINSLSQNGRQFGNLSSVSVNNQGIVNAVFDNGDSRQLSQIPVVTFNNDNGLTPLSGNVFTQTDESGDPVAKISGAGGAGLVNGSAVEQSTVDLADEFTKLIVTQRAFSANTRIITTADEMLEELIRAKR